MLHSNRSRSPYEDGTKPETVQTGRLDPSCGYVDLIAHELWALLASRHYLATDPAAAGLRNRVEVLAGSEVLSDRSRRELGEVAYLLRALNPKGDR